MERQLLISLIFIFALSSCQTTTASKSTIQQKIEINKKGKVRRARIFYLRELTGKKARIKELRK